VRSAVALIKELKELEPDMYLLSFL
jgi:hypothetical protein